jgi:hypothetical protein
VFTYTGTYHGKDTGTAWADTYLNNGVLDTDK